MTDNTQQQANGEALTLVLQFDRESHNVAIGGTIKDYATSVAVLRQALDYFETMKLSAAVSQDVLRLLRDAADQSRVSTIIGGRS